MKASVLSIAILICIFPSIASAGSSHVFVASPSETTGIGSFRIGYHSWEIGFLTTEFFGFDKILKKKVTYVAWGLGISILGDSAPGCYVAIGLDTPLLGGLAFRGEFNATGASNGSVRGIANVGLSFHF